VLSGFLIYHRYANAYFSQTNWSWRKYLQNRFARIFPLYALLLLVTAGINAGLSRPMSWPLLVLNITLVKGFIETYKFSGIAQSWSLTVEVCFYLSAPLLFVALRHWGAFFLTAALIGFGIGLWITTGRAAEHELFRRLPFMLFYTFFGRSFEFVVGMWLARRWYKNRLLPVRYATISGLFLLSTCVIWQAYVPTLTAEPVDLIWSEVIVYNFILPVGIVVFFLGLLREASGIQRLLSQPIVQALGQSSYAFYLIHIGVLASGLQKMGVADRWLLFGLLVLIALGLYIFVEKLLHRWLRASG